MHLLQRLSFLVLLLFPGALSAQKPQEAIRGEHRFQFVLDSDLSAYQEKTLVEQITGLEPEMHVSIDRETRLLKVLAYLPIDPQEVVALGAQNGVSLTVRRRWADSDSQSQPKE